MSVQGESKNFAIFLVTSGINSATSDTFAELVKMKNSIRLWDAQFAWYSPSATHWICLNGLGNGLGIHGFRPSWPFLTVTAHRKLKLEKKKRSLRTSCWPLGDSGLNTRCRSVKHRWMTTVIKKWLEKKKKNPRVLNLSRRSGNMRNGYLLSLDTIGGSKRATWIWTREFKEGSRA